MKTTSVTLCLFLALIAGTTQAAWDLQVTEIWPGNEPGSNLTQDWFELTNFGDTAFTFGAGNDGVVWFDDESADVTVADELMGIASIAPGESVVFVDDDDSSAWLSVWGPDLANTPQVGYYAGSGLGQGGDAVVLFITADGSQPTDAIADFLAFQSYPDAESNGGQSYDPVIGAFSGYMAVTTTMVNDEGQPGVGTPGYLVPEPAAAALALLALAGVAARRSR